MGILISKGLIQLSGLHPVLYLSSTSMTRTRLLSLVAKDMPFDRHAVMVCEQSMLVNFSVEDKFCLDIDFVPAALGFHT